MTAGHTTLHRNGGWTVELERPLKDSNGKDVLTLTFNPLGLEHVIRWGRGDIPSTMALMAEVTGVSEGALRGLTYPDVDRVMLAFTSVLPALIRTDFEEGKRPLVTPRPEGEENQPGEVLLDAVDEVDPRFPKVTGPVERITPQPSQPAAKPQVPPAAKPPPSAEDDMMNINPPEASRRVG